MLGKALSASAFVSGLNAIGHHRGVTVHLVAVILEWPAAPVN